MHKKIALFIILSVHILFQNISTAETITLAADPWCPYNCAPDSKLKGYAMEIAELAFSPHNIKIEYVILPWSRAIRSVLEGRNDGVIGVDKIEAPELIFPAQKIGKPKLVFYTNKTSTWKYTGISSLQDISIGIIQDYSYGKFDEIFANEIDENRLQKVSSVNGLAQNIEKLKNNRIDTLIAESNVFNFFIYKNNISQSFREAGVASIDENYIAFSPKNPKAKIYANILSQKIEQLRKTGQLAKILKKYNLQDWH
jgi:polar amino acid transport system substrate-binding protein